MPCSACETRPLAGTKKTKYAKSFHTSWKLDCVGECPDSPNEPRSDQIDHQLRHSPHKAETLWLLEPRRKNDLLDWKSRRFSLSNIFFSIVHPFQETVNGPALTSFFGDPDRPTVPLGTNGPRSRAYGITSSPQARLVSQTKPPLFNFIMTLTYPDALIIPNTFAL